MMTAAQQHCQQCAEQFTIEPEDFAFYTKMNVLPPVDCPICRFKRRAVFRNERTLYSRMCGLCTAPIVSVYHPDSPYAVYCHGCWNSDRWDPKEYAQPFDPQRPFFEQLQELFLRVPKETTFLTGVNVNSDYCSNAGRNKNCYMLFNSGFNEECLYSRGLWYSKESMDLYASRNNERCIEDINTHDSYQTFNSQHVSNCSDVWFAYDVVNGDRCVGSVNQRHSRFQWFNESLTETEFNSRLQSFRGSYRGHQELQKKFDAFALQFPHRSTYQFQSEDCVGDYIFGSSNCYFCFEAINGERVKYGFSFMGVKDSYDILGFGSDSELLLECVGTGFAQRIIGSFGVELSHEVEYSFKVTNSHNCIGCDGMNNAVFSILNLSYNEAEYQRIRKQIVNQLRDTGVYGHFFPSALAPFAYNETVAQDYFPLSQADATKNGFRWQEHLPYTSGKETLQPDLIPDHIRDVDNGILSQILRCITCSKNYKIIAAELTLYRSMVIPLPRQCFSCRHEERLRRRGPLQIFQRACAKCQKDIQSNYSSGRPETVYCLECFQQEVQ